MNISEYTKRLGIDTSPKVSPLDIEAGKAGYGQYLADIESFKKAQEETIASAESKKSWWDKASDLILHANQMSSNMSDNPVSSGFNAAVEAYKNMPDDNKPGDDWTDDEWLEYQVQQRMAAQHKACGGKIRKRKKGLTY